MRTNDSIKCCVKDCAHHAQEAEYCTLNSIKVGACETTPRTKEGTDCESFTAR